MLNYAYFKYKLCATKCVLKGTSISCSVGMEVAHQCFSQRFRHVLSDMSTVSLAFEN